MLPYCPALYCLFTVIVALSANERISTRNFDIMILQSRACSYLSNCDWLPFKYGKFTDILAWRPSSIHAFSETFAQIGLYTPDGRSISMCAVCTKRRFAGRWTRWAAVSGSGKGQAQRACARAVLCRGGIWRDQKYGILKTFYRISVCIAERVGLERVNSSFLSLAYAIDQPKSRRIK